MLSPSSDPHPVSAATAQRVQEAAQELEFVPSAIARGLVGRRSGQIGLLVPDLTDPFYPSIANGVVRSARQEGLSVLIFSTLGEEPQLRDYLTLLRARRVDAVVISGGSSLSRAELGIAAQLDVPVVLIGRPIETDSPALPYVSIDNVAAARAATQHLVDLGRRRLLHLAGPATQSTMKDRRAGFTAALAAASGELSMHVLETSGAPEDGYRLLRALLDDIHQRPDAIFAATDRLAVAAMAAIHDAALAIPRDVAVIGFDDIPLAALLRPSLSSVRQPAEALGEKAIELALRLAAGESGTAIEPVVLQAQPVFRDSTQF